MKKKPKKLKAVRTIEKSKALSPVRKNAIIKKLNRLAEGKGFKRGAWNKDYTDVPNIDGVVVWSRTQEGQKYWSKINDILNNRN